MAIINSYSEDSTIHGEDKLIGSDGTTGADAGVTKNYSVDALASFMRTTGLLGDVTIRNLTTTGAIYVTINTIQATPGASRVIRADEHFNVITFTGGNGTYVIELPPSEEGLMLRFKTDDTITNSKDIALQPVGGETIDGAVLYTMDRGYDGITILGFQGNWLVVQKKDK